MSNYRAIESNKYKGWYEIPGYSFYCANEKGQILNKKNNRITYGGRAGRYLRVSVTADNNDKPILQYVHILIALAFYGRPNGRFMVVMHSDNNRFNNSKSNLSWGEQSENIKQVYEDGLKYSREFSHVYEARQLEKSAALMPESKKFFDLTRIEQKIKGWFGW